MASYQSPHIEDRHGAGCDGTTSHFLNPHQAESAIRTTWLMGNQQNFQAGRLVVEFDHKEDEVSSTEDCPPSPVPGADPRYDSIRAMQSWLEDMKFIYGRRS
ncbi:hypothetical protein ACOMHN_036921 [Nucella lapillus]